MASIMENISLFLKHLEDGTVHLAGEMIGAQDMITRLVNTCMQARIHCLGNTAAIALVVRSRVIPPDGRVSIHMSIVNT